MSVVEKTSKLRLVVLASGRGSNLQALLDAEKESCFPAEVVAVLSDNENALALERARSAGVEAKWLNPAREDFDEKLLQEVAALRPGLICCAGYMRILPTSFVRGFFGKIINIHPSLLPSFPGLRAQKKALRAGVRISGCTVHFIDEGVDTGPIILQAAVPVMRDDDEERLSNRILGFEHRLFPLAVKLIAEGKIRLKGNRVCISSEAAWEYPEGFFVPFPAQDK